MHDHLVRGLGGKVIEKFLWIFIISYIIILFIKGTGTNKGSAKTKQNHGAIQVVGINVPVELACPRAYDSEPGLDDEDILYGGAGGGENATDTAADNIL